ncbi:alpha/beta hydrolase [Pelagibacterium sp. 26DY04]|uniref:alpha/beta family hydrolase n=1 Tax=Pelagibacterium sp. 26DY04 TaxID=2967130 RepID=UPI0028162E12|nr:alpha/beta family hydrolase [Pelagibacterium sp. 26DY04]WMT85469.1 alpha/beta hydrolase [Pelagibacterium sp. 26DY04]
MTDFLFSGGEDAAITLLLAHGAGAAMDSAAMNAATDALVAAGLRVVRFEFAYMASRRAGDGRKPPPRAETLLGEYRAAVDALESSGPLFIGGKSMGGRVATMVADELHSAGRIQGVVCLGYPFHPPAKPDQLRTRHLEHLKCPLLICQGTRDPFGTVEEVPGYALSDAVRIEWLEDGDHDLKPRKAISGFTAAQHLETMAKTVAAWTRDIAARA